MSKLRDQLKEHALEYLKSSEALYPCDYRTIAWIFNLIRIESNLTFSESTLDKALKELVEEGELVQAQGQRWYKTATLEDLKLSRDRKSKALELVEKKERLSELARSVVLRTASLGIKTGLGGFDYADTEEVRVRLSFSVQDLQALDALIAGRRRDV